MFAANKRLSLIAISSHLNNSVEYMLNSSSVNVPSVSPMSIILIVAGDVLISISPTIDITGIEFKVE